MESAIVDDGTPGDLLGILLVGIVAALAFPAIMTNAVVAALLAAFLDLSSGERPRAPRADLADPVRADSRPESSRGLPRLRLTRVN